MVSPTTSAWEMGHDVTVATELHFRHITNLLVHPQTPTPTLAEGLWVCQGRRAFPFLTAHAAWGVPAAQRVVNTRSSHVRVKDYGFATKGRIQCLSSGVRAG